MMEWLVDEDDGVRNIKESHDNYMVYARDLLKDTRGRINRMSALSQEIRYLASRIQPAIIETETREREKHIANLSTFVSPGTEECAGEEISARKQIPVQRISFTGKEIVPKDIRTWCGVENRIPARSASKTCDIALGTTTDFKIKPNRTQQRQQKCQKQSVPSPPRLQTTSQYPLICERIPSKKGRTAPAKSLKLCVVLPGCDVGGNDREPSETSDSSCDGAISGSGNIGNTRSHSRERKRIPREILQIPRVIMQSFSTETSMCETRLPDILENIPKPLQLTARKYRLPALKREST